MRRRADWVYRPHIRDETGGLADGLGSYEGTNATLSGGIAGAQARILYDSFNYRSGMFPDIGGGNAPGFLLGSSARAEGSNPKIHRVEGTVRMQPTTWALGDRFGVAFRFGVFEQDPTSGLLLVDAAYTIHTATATTMLNPAQWANSRTWQHERRVYFAAADSSNVFVQHFRFRVNRVLKPHECYALYVERAADGNNVSMMYWFRTLVSDEG